MPTHLTSPSSLSIIGLTLPLLIVANWADPPLMHDQLFNEEDSLFPTSHRKASVSKRQANFPESFDPNSRYEACEMLIAFDETLYDHYGGDVDNLTSLAVTLVDKLNAIYTRRVLAGPTLGSIYFRIKEIRIAFDFCTECNETQRVFLSEFSDIDTSDFCLAHIFTYRDFPEGIQGLAWRNTTCHYYWNTGFTTLLNHQVQASVDETAMTFAHEVGHNLGAHHDEERNCGDDHIMSEGGSFIAHPSFSTCSIDDISSNLTQLLRNSRANCMVRKPATDPPDWSFCGDYKVTGDEECDCGLDYRTCRDPCCYAARIDPWQLYYNKSAVPCRRHNHELCLKPFNSLWVYGFVAPWIFIAIVTLIVSIVLAYDWKHRKILYTHITEPAAPIRSETSDQIANRHKRESTRSSNGYSKGAFVNVEGNNSA